MPLTRPLERLVRRPLALADALCNRLYGWRYNPLYQSGTIVVVLLVVLIVTGIWLLLFYRVGAPWASVARLTDNLWTGNWVRGLHRYASDAALVATGIHILRMFAQERTWGPRTLAWVSGLVSVGILVVCGVTGFIMVWDTFGHGLALETARLLDALPILSEPISRAFVGERPVPGTFFFLNLFAHSALPLAVGVGVWIHVARLARPTLLPPRALTWTVVGLLTLVAILWPLPMAPEANPFALPQTVPTDWFFGFWLPLSERLPAGIVWLLGLSAVGIVAAVPWLARRTGHDHPAPSVVDRQLCTACNQCVVDCPYEAIAMVPRTGDRGLRADGRSERVARVNASRCVSCGICAGSCAPMGVGPVGRTGRAQLDEFRQFLAASAHDPDRIVVLACDRGPASLAPALAAADAELHAVACTGNLHTSVIEHAVRSGALGVLVLSCPPRDCWGREGPRWLDERLYHDREAELQARVDRRRVRVAYVNAAERHEALTALRAFRADLAGLAQPALEPTLDLDLVCNPIPLEEEDAAR
ncbi:MAG: hydrogenase iron-sulfur subunit [Gemmatimonadota bacterium]|nr:hydrogenase iron-sulfur subunit [Gemmatimonadota bacterium]